MYDARMGQVRSGTATRGVRVSPEGKRWLKLGAHLQTGAFLLFIAYWMAGRFGTPFVPAPAVLHALSSTVAFAIGLALATPAILVFLDKAEDYDARTLSVAALGWPLFAFAFAAAMKLGVPYALSHLPSGPVSYAYTVADPQADESYSSRNRCLSPITLDAPMMLFGDICDVPESVRDALTVGGSVELVGQGNRFGVRVTHIRAPGGELWPL